MEINNQELWARKEIIQHVRLLNSSFAHWTGNNLLADEQDDLSLSFLLYNAPFVVVSHTTDLDPVFNYTNLAAQKLWEIPWSDFIGMPSRLSAQADAVVARQRLLEEASKNGFVENYEGIRITSRGKRFYIKDVILWNVIDGRQNLKGQAAMFSNWEFIS
jgi:hypothetical protein